MPLQRFSPSRHTSLGTVRSGAVLRFFCMAWTDLARVKQVEAANLFIALVPSLKHQEILGSVGHSGTTKLCNSNAELLYHGTFDHFVGPGKSEGLSTQTPRPCVISLQYVAMVNRAPSEPPQLPGSASVIFFSVSCQAWAQRVADARTLLFVVEVPTPSVLDPSWFFLS